MNEQRDPDTSDSEPPSSPGPDRQRRPSALETLAARPSALEPKSTQTLRRGAGPQPSAIETMAAARKPQPSVVGTLVSPSAPTTVDTGHPEPSATGTWFRGSSASRAGRSIDLGRPPPLRDGNSPIEAPEGVDRNLALARLRERMLGAAPEAVKIGRFIVIRKLGQGAMGIVYLAYDPKLDRKVALKLVDTSALGTEMGDAQVRLEREAKAAAALGHPNVVTVYDVGNQGDDVFLAMEYVDGAPLTDWMKGEHGWRETVALFAEVARGLAAAHDAGLTHRDFKPDNVLLGQDGRPRVADFGLARPTEGWSARDAAQMLGSGDGTAAGPLAIRSGNALASTGEVCGTPAYMAPEQFAGLDVGTASDQFGFCASLFEALFGRRPFTGESVTELAVAVLENDRESLPSGHGVPSAVVEAVLKGLEPGPGDRHASMHVLADRLDAALRARTRNRILGGAAVLAVLGVGFGARASQAMQEQPCEAGQTEIDETWSAQRGSDVREALHAAGLGADVVRTLDTFAGSWTQQRVASCEATRVEGQVSDEDLALRTACLDRARTRLDVAAEALTTEPTAETLQAVEPALGNLAECGDLRELREKQAFEHEGRSSVLAQAARNDVESDMAFLLLHQHQPTAAWVDVAESLTQRGREHDLADAVAVGLRWQGRAALRHDEFDAADSAFSEALPYAARALDRQLVPEILKASAQAALLSDRLPQARERAQLAIAMSARILDGQTRRAFQDQARVTLAEVDLRSTAPASARAAMEDLLSTTETRPPLLQERIHSTLGSACRQMQDLECAFEHHAAAMELVAGLPDVDPLELAGRHANMGLMYAEAGDAEQAVEQLTEAADIVEDAFDAGHPMRAQLLSDMGGIQGAMLDPRDGEENLLSGLAIHEAHRGPDHPDLVEPLIDLAKTQLALGKPAEAKKHAQRAVTLVDAAFEGQHPRRADPRLALSEAYAAAGRFDEAAEVLREGLQILDTPQTHPMQRAEFRFALARALAPTDPRAARDAAQQAKVGIADFEPGAPLVAAIDGWSSEALGDETPSRPAQP